MNPPIVCAHCGASRRKVSVWHQMLDVGQPATVCCFLPCSACGSRASHHVAYVLAHGRCVA